MILLFFDTETTGFPPYGRLVSIAWQTWIDNKLINKQHHLIIPEGFFIPHSATKIHGITTKMAIETGIPLQKALTKFANEVKKADYIIAHNYKFDKTIIENELKKINHKNFLSEKQFIDTMLISTPILKLKTKNGRIKYPKLQELYQYLFNKNFYNAHSADADVNATVECFFELKKLGHIKI